MTIWFTSDTHYGHTNVIKYCNRPFDNVREMDDALLTAYNERVKPGDTVYHLGDFCFSREPEKIVRKLHGNIHLILGNHDKKKYLRSCNFAWMRDVYMLRAGKHQFWLSHYAHLRWPKSHYGTFHLFGHSHGALEGYGRSVDVGVDNMDFAPIALEDVVEILQNKPLTEHH